MRNWNEQYIDGKWVGSRGGGTIDVINPATEQVAGRIAAGSVEDVDLAVAAAARAFEQWSQSSVDTRVEYMEALLNEFDKRADDLALAVTEEMGAPASISSGMQVAIGRAHIAKAPELLRRFDFAEKRGRTLVVREPIGVCALITPWNWPLNQVTCKLMPAISTGCTVVLKPSEFAPFSAHILAEIVEKAGLPAGVFNLVNGTGPVVGNALAEHRDVALISITGSTRAGVSVARAAAPTVKRVHQELGGKSPNIILDDEGLTDAVVRGVSVLMLNSGQTCSAPTRMLVPAHRMTEAAEAAKSAAEAITVGDPTGDASMGPVVSRTQWDKVQRLIETGVQEGATLVTGGTGRPAGLETGFYVKPTVFSDVRPTMTIAREEIFGPVLSILGYDGLDDAVAIANDTDYGLAAYVNGLDLEAVRDVAARIRAGQVMINELYLDYDAPFGGYKQSGNGREWSVDALAEYVETKAVLGYEAP